MIVGGGEGVNSSRIKSNIHLIPFSCQAARDEMLTCFALYVFCSSLRLRRLNNVLSILLS